jgi:hypothetical protein
MLTSIQDDKNNYISAFMYTKTPSFQLMSNNHVNKFVTAILQEKLIPKPKDMKNTINQPKP